MDHTIIKADREFEKLIARTYKNQVLPESRKNKQVIENLFAASKGKKFYGQPLFRVQMEKLKYNLDVAIIKFQKLDLTDEELNLLLNERDDIHRATIAQQIVTSINAINKVTDRFYKQ